jgi:UDP-glucose 4-epimerase
MRALVTGGAGYIGSVVAERLIEAGHEVVVADDLSTGHREAVPSGAVLVVVDLRDRRALRAALAGRSFDAVIHLAASSLVGESMEDPGKYFENNLVGGVNLLEESTAAGAKRFVLSSTAATYGEPKEVPITENSDTVPTNPYGESKLLFERILAWYSRLGRLSWISLRYFNAAGASEMRGEDREHETHLIPLVLDAASTGGEVRVFGDDYPTPDGACVRDYIHVLDLADAHILSLPALDRGVQGVFNLGSGTGFSVNNVIAVAEKVTGKSIRRRVAPRRPGDPATLVASSRRAQEVLGWRPQRADLESIVRSAWTWRQRHPHGYRSGATRTV